MFRLAADVQGYLHREAIDFRVGINGLAILVVTARHGLSISGRYSNVYSVSSEAAIQPRGLSVPTCPHPLTSLKGT